MTGKKGKQGYGGGQQIEHTEKIKDDKQATKKTRKKARRSRLTGRTRC